MLEVSVSASYGCASCRIWYQHSESVGRPAFAWLVEEWKGDTICDDGSYVPANFNCPECPPDTPIYLDCETFGWDDGDCVIP